MPDELNKFRVLFVEDSIVHRSDVMRLALNRLENALKSCRISSTRTYSYNDAELLAANDMDLDCFLIASDMNSDRSGESRTIRLLRIIQRHQRKAPVFLLCDREHSSMLFSSISCGLCIG